MLVCLGYSWLFSRSVLFANPCLIYNIFTFKTYFHFLTMHFQLRASFLLQIPCYFAEVTFTVLPKI